MVNDKVFNEDGELLTCTCPVCGALAYPYPESYRACKQCGWMDDSYQAEHPDEDNLLNFMSLNQARDAWKAGQPIQ